MLSPELQAGLILLGNSDRRWLLAQLSPGERRRMRSVFRSLGEVPVTTPTAAAPVVAPVVAAANGDPDLRLLEAASADEIRGVLSGLPASCVAVVLHSVRGAWSAEVSAGFEVSRQVAIGACLREIQATPPNESFRRWLLRELADVIRQGRSQSAAPARRFDALLDGVA